MTTHEQTGRVRVSIETSASAETAFAALVQPDKLASWFGAPTTPLREGGATRIEFGDGDFFSVDGAGSLLTLSHVGWENIDARDEVQRRQRKRFCGLWVDSLTRARAHAGAT
jgi:hypothetical protein